MIIRVYSWLARVAAPSLHHAHGEAMAETFAHRLRAARLGRHKYVRFLSREFAGLFALIVTERFDSWARAKRRQRRSDRRHQAGGMDTFTQDIALALRRLWQTPSFTVASVLTLGLTIGANTAIFAVVERVVLRPLPYPESDRLIELDHGSQRLNFPSGMGLNQGLYFHYGDRARSIERAALFRAEDATVVGSSDPERIRISRATPSLVAVLQVAPAIGRWFAESEGEPAGANVVVLSHGYWLRRFGRDANVLGRAITVGGVDSEIIGVMPPAFAFPEARVEMWLPIKLNRAAGFGLWTWSGLARLRPGSHVADARREFASLIADLPRAYPNDAMAAGNAQIGLSFSGRTLKDATLGNVERALWTLLAAMGGVLLIACANVANLFLVRSETRQREIAVRRALGASASKMARYFFTESTLLAIAAGLLGLGIAAAAVRILVRQAPISLPRLHEIQLDPSIVAFAIVLSTLTAVVFGLVPLSRRHAALTMLNDGGRWSSASRRRHFFRHVLMGAQVALALVLLVASALMIRSFQNLRTVEPGFDAASALTFTIGLSARDYGDVPAAIRAHHAILDGLAALPGARAVATATCLPLAGGCFGNTVRVQGRTYSNTEPPTVALMRGVSGGYFETMGMRLLSGRGLTREDVEREYPVAVISEQFARQFFAGQDPIGKRVASNRPPGGEFEWLEVVGVVANTPTRALNEPTPAPILYLPMSFAATPQNQLRGPGAMVMTYVVRTAMSPLDLLPSVRQSIATVDRSLAIAQPRTLEDILEAAAAQMGFTMMLIALAGFIALLLGVIGIYGVMSFVVSQRTTEIGVRLALGAEPGTVAKQILTQGGIVALAGLGIGLAFALATATVMTSLLFAVSPRDPVVFACTPVALLLVALVACWVPARRAARLNPVEALRAD